MKSALSFIKAIQFEFPQELMYKEIFGLKGYSINLTRALVFLELTNKLRNQNHIKVEYVKL